MDDRGIEVTFPAEEEIFLFITASRLAVEPSLLFEGYPICFTENVAAGK
jgi:hypothetical protein